MKYLRELVRLQKKVTDGSKVKRRDVETMAKLLMRNNNVKGDYRELAPMLTDLYEFMNQKKPLMNQWLIVFSGSCGMSIAMNINVQPRASLVVGIS